MSELEGEVTAVAHELKTPLVLLRQLSLQLENTKNTADSQMINERIRLTAERALRLVDSLTKVSQLEGAMFELEPVQLNGLCLGLVDDLTPTARAHHQSITVRLTRKPIVAVANRELLDSMVSGLIDNAIQHNPLNSRVEVISSVQNNEAVLSVRDYGSTIDLSDFRALQESLGKKAQPVSSRPLASSLGLAVAGRLLLAMDGHLSMQRHYGGGVTFSAHLPLSRQLSLLEV